MSKALKGKKLPEEVKQKLREKAKMRKEQKNKMFDQHGNLDENIKKQMIEAMASVQGEQNSLIVEEKAPEDSICPNCTNNSLTIKRMILTGPWSGHISCDNCDYKATLINFLSTRIIKVEPIE